MLTVSSDIVLPFSPAAAHRLRLFEMTLFICWDAFLILNEMTRLHVGTSRPWQNSDISIAPSLWRAVRDTWTPFCSASKALHKYSLSPAHTHRSCMWAGSSPNCEEMKGQKINCGGGSPPGNNWPAETGLSSFHHVWFWLVSRVDSTRGNRKMRKVFFCLSVTNQTHCCSAACFRLYHPAGGSDSSADRRRFFYESNGLRPGSRWAPVTWELVQQDSFCDSILHDLTFWSVIIWFILQSDSLGSVVKPLTASIKSTFWFSLLSI